LLVLEGLILEEAKTKPFMAALKMLQIQDALIVVEDCDQKLEKSARNIPGIQVIECEGLNVHDVLQHEYLIFLRSSLEKVERKLRP
jgi:large subunit ribosomal protein L4